MMPTSVFLAAIVLLTFFVSSPVFAVACDVDDDCCNMSLPEACEAGTCVSCSSLMTEVDCNIHADSCDWLGLCMAEAECAGGPAPEIPTIMRIPILLAFLGFVLWYQRSKRAPASSAS